MTLPAPRWTIVLGTCTCAAASAYVGSADPAAGGYPRCFFHEATGLYCAGCGATRALYAVLHGRILDALHDNALFVALLPVALIAGVPYAGRVWSADRWPPLKAPRLFAIGASLFALMMFFMILRNWPGQNFAWLRPPA